MSHDIHHVCHMTFTMCVTWHSPAHRAIHNAVNECTTRCFHYRLKNSTKVWEQDTRAAETPNWVGPTNIHVYVHAYMCMIIAEHSEANEHAHCQTMYMYVCTYIWVSHVLGPWGQGTILYIYTSTSKEDQRQNQNNTTIQVQCMKDLTCMYIQRCVHITV